MDRIRAIWDGRNPAAERAKRILETLFLALSAVYLVYLFTLDTTLFPPYPLRLERTMIIALAAVTALRLALVGPKHPELWLAAALALLYNAVHHSDGYGFLWFLAVLSAGCARIDYRRILKLWLIAVGGALAVTVLAALAGSIENIVYYRDGLRSSWGVKYPTDLATLALFLLVMLWVLWRRLPDWAMLPIGVAAVALIFAVTLSRNALLCGALFLCAVAWHWLEGAALSKRPGGRRLQKGVDVFLILAFPLFAAVTYLMVFLYARGLPLGQRLDALLSGRLAQCLDGVRSYGIRLFGQPFDMIGNGFSVFPQLNVNFIDSSYVLIPLRYGWALLIALGALWSWTTHRALRCGDRRLALAMGLIAFHSILEHHFTEVHYNILLAMPFAAYAAARESEARAPKGAGRPARAAGSVTALAAVVSAWLAGPWVLTRLRTLFQAEGWIGGGAGAIPTVAAIVAVLACALGALWAIWRLVRALVARERGWIRALAGLTLCLVVAGGLFAAANQAVDRAARENAALLDEDSAALAVIIGAAEEPVYSDALPDVYQERFGEIRDTALPLEDLARQSGGTVLTDVDPERNVFFHRGFRYAQISPEHAVYTADEAVVDALEAAGYALSEYYDTAHSVDLADAAERNGLSLAGDALPLDGPEKSLLETAPEDLFEGEYEAVFALRLPERADAAPGEVCALRVSAYEGEMPLAEVAVDRGQFDAEGRLTASVRFAVGYARGTQFQVLAREGRGVIVEGIGFRKVRVAEAE